MVRKKRSYVPKVKGCYQCSQRRVDCDGTKPSCSKCISRGIACSGFEFKYRFLNGFAGTCKAPRRARSSHFRSNVQSHDISVLPEESIEGSHSNRFDRTWRCLRGNSALGGNGDASCGTISSPTAQAYDAYGSHISDLFITIASDSSNGDSSSSYSEETDMPTLRPCPNPTIHASNFSLTSLSHLEPWKEFLLSYFSDNIAPEMVVLDDDHNGWRHFILPIACSDELIMSAVLAVSTIHMAGRVPSPSVVGPNKPYGQAIRELQNRRHLTECAPQTRQFVILAIIVLLVAVMVNGCSDFPIIFNMLESALGAAGGEDGLLQGGQVGEFCLRQIRKMRVYAAPLLSQDAGLHAILCQAQESFDCLYYYSGLHPNHLQTFELIADLRQQSFNIYLDRALPGEACTSPATPGMIEQFTTTLQSFPQGSPGEHVLVWPVFIAASESREVEHRQILKSFLEKQYRRNGFGNIPRALHLLKRIWALTTPQDWPAMLPEPQVFIM